MPSQVLAAINGDHLAGKSLAFQDEAHCRQDVLGIGTPAQGAGGALPSKMRLALALGAQGGDHMLVVNPPGYSLS